MEELKIFAKLRNVGGYKDIFRQQLERIFTTSSERPSRPKNQTPVPAPKPKKPIRAPKPKKHIPKDYKPKKITGAFGDKYIECRSKCVEIVSMKEYFENKTIFTWYDKRL